MKNSNIYDVYIGLDVHKETIAIAIACPERAGEIRFWGNINNTPNSVRHFFTKAGKNYTTMLVCYEAGPCGYGLYRQLQSMGIECQVIAPSRIAKSPTDRIKNDHRDAVSLARLLRAGDLTQIWVPDDTHEAMRDLIRARSASKKDTKIARQRIHSLLLRSGRIYDKKPWTARHRIWLANQSFSNPSQQVAFQHYLQALEQTENRTEQLEQEIKHLLAERLTEAHGQLTAEELAAYADEKVDIAQGLGKVMVMMGFSAGGTTSAWAAQTRNDIELTVIISPVFGFKQIPAVLTAAAMNVSSSLPDSYEWWGQQKQTEIPPAYAYPPIFNPRTGINPPAWHFNSVASNRIPPLAKRIKVVLNANDNAVNYGLTMDVVKNWQAHNAKLKTYEFTVNLKLGHDLIDPNKPDAKVEIVYPRLIKLVSR